MKKNKQQERKFIAPPPVRRGSLFRLVSPAGKCEAAPLTALTTWLEGEGFRVEWGKHLTGSSFQFAGTDQERLEDLQEALDDPSADVILCSRGGYGTIRLLEHLDFRGFRKHPKWVVGYSDITLLHSTLNHMGYRSLHGAMGRHSLGEDGQPNESFQSLMALLRGEESASIWAGNPLNRPGKRTAPLTGGNLSLLYALMGTPCEPDTLGKILYIEDIGEYLYHLDRMMVSLRLAGKLEGLAGLVVGYFTDMKDNEDPFGKNVEEIILDAVRDYGYPVAFGFPAGHEHPNQALVCGGTYTLMTETGLSSLVLEREHDLSDQ